MKCTNATKVNRKSGVAQWRDLLYMIRGIKSEGKRHLPLCHPDRSEAKWRDLLYMIRGIESEWKRHLPLCHPDRSEAEWRDLQFNGPVLVMFFDRS
jgi:hypothetical protein